MNSLTAMVTGAGLGCIAMYGLDPEMGRRRRALARDKMIKIQHKAGEAAGVTARDLKNRTLGTLAEGRARLTEWRVGDEELAERVRSEIGFLARYPSFIDVQARNGSITLTGHAFTDECEQLVEGVRSVHGVREVENRVEAHQGSETFPGLRGQILRPKPTGRPMDIMQRHWAPTTRLFVSTAALAGIGALAYSFVEVNGQLRSYRILDRIRPRKPRGILGRIRETLHR